MRRLWSQLNEIQAFVCQNLAGQVSVAFLEEAGDCLDIN